MEFSKTITIEINPEEIIDYYDLNAESNLDEIAEAVHDYVACPDDMAYWVIGEIEEQKIREAVSQKLKAE